jgi:integrating conjugative element membrane protein (TIGR03747 family)
MTEQRNGNDNRQPAQQQPPKKHGLLYNMLWGWPWALVGILLASLFFSLVIEWAGMLFLWPDAGAAHSEQVMNTELGWLSTEFTRSLMLSQPSVTLVHWITQAYQWAFVDSGFTGWISHQYSAQLASHNAITRETGRWSAWLAAETRDYLQAAIWVTIITLIRATILVLSVPLFVLVLLVALTEGLGRRDLRRYGAAYESSFVYHRAKALVKPALYIPCMLYLSWPTAVYPNLLLLPAAILFGLAVTVTVASFKKYL